ncbi:MAG: hypothetical protein J7623_27440 [Chitinophaga sp.]|uniref:hypothetical protein n=1 Tax=Chitinophaga sp. TaxID=1869181 RepID=UPI001B05D04D|nr:hypothetical protein [Chitinophaga sp.]MBO9732406.1 hypothetical protein [Chitinophaga sp.]
MNIHEYVHTQPNYGYNLLSQSLCEGASDFITALVTGKQIPLPYMDYGKAKETSLKEKFKSEMFGDPWDTWLYNNGHGTEVADLGYFMGYRICQSFYQRVKNKKQAVKEIIGLNFQDSIMIENFLSKSGYYPEGFNKAALLATLESKISVVTNVASATVNLKPGTRYGFIMTNRSFRSAEGYPLNPYEVKFEMAPQ